MTDVVFYLKAAPTAAERAFAWPRDTKLIALDPVAAGMGCGGADPYCSSAYSSLYSSLRGSSGAMDNLLARYARGVRVQRVAFVGFSAAHGFLNPFLDDDRDRARTSGVVLLDACFGGGKTGYQKALRDAASGHMLYATTTSNSGSAWSANTDLTSGTICFVNNVLRPTGLTPRSTSARSPMPAPSGGAWKIGSRGYWLEYANRATGATELHHYDMGKVQAPMVQAYLLAYWQGKLGLPWGVLGGAVIGAAGAYGAWRIYKS